jgi:FkbM family methyltransferase
MIKSIIKKLFSPKSDIEKLLVEAKKFKRYQIHDFTFRGFKLNVTDFISVAWQLKEFFIDGRTKFISETEKPLIYDCGANVGVSVLYFKRQYPKAIIKCFEPDPKILSCLKKNLSQNNITDVIIFESAVWKNNDGILFGSEGADGGSIYKDSNKLKLPSVRLKDLLEKEVSIDLLKMDIEGAELEVILDCINEIKKIKYLFIEYHSWINNKQDLDLLLKAISDSGFRYYIQSIGEVLEQPFINRNFQNGMDIQLDIHAINVSIKK